MPEPQGAELDRIRERRQQLRLQYLKDQPPQSSARGVHHVALICRDVEETINFYQGLLGFPLVEMVENRDYAGSTHFFFDVGHGNLLGFFDFPGHEHPDFRETVGGIQHIALSVDKEHFDAAKQALDERKIDYLGPDRGVEDSIYLRDPNGAGIELYNEEIGVFNGVPLIKS
jgi:glyoxylase I family protein